MIVGVAGGSGSGKTTLTKKLVERFGDAICVVHHDNYYRAHDDLTYEERTHLNYDCPDSFETDLLVEHLKKLKRGESIECPVYDYTIHNRTDKTILIKPAEVILVEGILVLYDERLQN